MNTRKVLARTAGILCVLFGLANLLGLLVPDVREQIISLGAVLFRYGGFVVVGIGLILLQRWSAYIWSISMIVNVVLLYTVYGKKTESLSGELSLLNWAGPVLIIGLFYYLWPVLKSNIHQAEE